MIRRIHFVVEWKVAGCIQSRREMRTWMRTTHNKYTRVPTVARWKMGFRKARFRSYEQVRGRSDDKASFRFIQTGPRTIARLRRTESQNMRKRVDPTFLIFFLMVTSWPSDLFLEIKAIRYWKPGRHLYSLVVKRYSVIFLYLIFTEMMTSNMNFCKDNDNEKWSQYKKLFL